MFRHVIVWLVLAVIHANAATFTNTSTASHTESSDTSVTVVDVPGTSTSSLIHSHSSLQPSTRNVSLTTTAINNATTVLPSSSTRNGTPASIGITASPTSYVSTQKNPISTSTKAQFPWKYISFGLFGLVAILLVAFIITCICTYKLKKRLGQVSKTLYPIVPERNSSNEYLDLEASGDGTHHGNVELTSMQVHHEEEFVTTKLPSTPDKPPRRQRQPPPPPTSKPPKKQSDARQGNTKANGKVTQGGGLPNAGFQMEEKHDGGIPGMDAINLYAHDEGLYESYEQNGNSNPSGAMEDMDEQQAYEEPISKATVKQDILSEDGLRRQDSSTGLPDVPPRHVPGGHQTKHKTPLEMTDEDAFESEQFDPSGIPLSTMQFDESQYFDFETGGTPDANFNMDLTDNRDSFVDIPSHHYHVLEVESQDNGLNILDADTAKDETSLPDELNTVAVGNTNEPGHYEHFEDEFAGQNNNTGFVSTEPTFDPEFDIVDGMGGFEEEHYDSEEGTVSDYENTPAPIVPPRRDLARKQSESEIVTATAASAPATATTAASVDTSLEVVNDSSPTGSNVYAEVTRSKSPIGSFDSNGNEEYENGAVLKAGKNLRGSKIRKLDTSYFLDINDKTTTIDELSISPEPVAPGDPLLVPGDPLLDISSTGTHTDMSSNNLDVLLADIPVIERPFEFSNDLQNPSVGDYVNIANQPMADLLGDYENITSSSPLDLLNGDIPNKNNGDDDSSEDVDYENAPAAVAQ